MKINILLLISIFFVVGQSVAQRTLPELRSFLPKASKTIGLPKPEVITRELPAGVQQELNQELQNNILNPIVNAFKNDINQKLANGRNQIGHVNYNFKINTASGSLTVQDEKVINFPLTVGLIKIKITPEEVSNVFESFKRALANLKDQLKITEISFDYEVIGRDGEKIIADKDTYYASKELCQKNCNANCVLVLGNMYACKGMGIAEHPMIPELAPGLVIPHEDVVPVHEVETALPQLPLRKPGKVEVSDLESEIQENLTEKDRTIRTLPSLLR